MKGNQKKYSLFEISSAVFMILALLWLTISIPFVYAGQQKLAEHNKTVNAGSPLSGNEEETNPFSNSTEEKAPNSANSFSEEYLHDHPLSDNFFAILPQYYKYENAGTYIAFHGELLVPPPDLA